MCGPVYGRERYDDKKPVRISRRTFCRMAAASAAFAAPAHLLGQNAVRFERAPALSGLGDRFADLSRHFVFEYYPWYRTMPFGHWNEADRRPPIDIASNYMPRLGPYDSRSTSVMAQHAE